MTLPNETIYNGASIICPDCKQIPSGPEVFHSPAGYYIGYGACNCGPTYSRESGYFKTYEEASKILQADASEYTRLIDEETN